MKKNTVWIVIGIVICFVLLILAGLLLLKYLFLESVRSTTVEAVRLLEACPLPESLAFEHERISDIAVVRKNPSPERLKEMITWCCENFDSSPKICNAAILNRMTFSNKTG